MGQLTSMQLRQLRSIMGISWHNKICNGEVLQRAKMERAEAILVKSQLRWAGHIVTMPDDRLPKAVMYAQLTEGQRKRGDQKLRYRDVLKHHLKAADIDTDSWESQASDRATWRKKVHDAVKTVEWKRKEKYLEGWRKRHPSHSTTLCHHRKTMGSQ